MTRLWIDVKLDEQGRPVFQLTPAQLAQLGLEDQAAPLARWEVAQGAAEAPSQDASPFRKYVGVAAPVEGGSVAYHRQALGYEE